MDSILKPANGPTLMAEGIGYYIQGKNEEALSLLKVVKDSLIYINPTLERQIQDIKKAIASQK
jgi:hypothetical protein